MSVQVKIKIPKIENRSIEQLIEHYEIEKELAQRLLQSNKKERVHLYTAVYDELYRKVPHHSQLTRKSSPEISAWIVAQRMQLLEHFLSPDLTFLEVGPGDCSLSVEIAKRVKKVYAVDVATELTQQLKFPGNFEFIISDGCSIPVPENSANVAYSHQLMEHLHPDDAIEQVQNIYKALAPNGRYICITPNQLSGPHDISRYFDETATGFHLKEYTVSELYELFRGVGFSKVSWVKSKGKTYIEIPITTSTLPIIRAIEAIISALPFPLRRTIANTPMLFRGMTIIGTK
jgi:SAM-dependent methyltransferase